MKPEPFAPWQCPLCGEPLTGDTALKCGRNHSFDRAKEGYWHLLPVQSMRTKAPGDSKEMVAARRAFLNAGYYGIFGRALGELCLAYGVPTGADAPLHLLDAGCGEGWYDRCIAQAFAQAGRPVQLAGFDIAKPAVRLAAKALPAAKYAVASSFAQPVRTGWADLLLNCFSPFAQEEFRRVLRPGGRMIYVVPGAEHLYQMKAEIEPKFIQFSRAFSCSISFGHIRLQLLLGDIMNELDECFLFFGIEQRHRRFSSMFGHA